MGLKSPFLVPRLLLTAAAFFFIKDYKGPSISEPSDSPATGVSTSAAPKRSTTQGLIESEKCLRRSKKSIMTRSLNSKLLKRSLAILDYVMTDMERVLIQS